MAVRLPRIEYATKFLVKVTDNKLWFKSTFSL